MRTNWCVLLCGVFALFIPGAAPCGPEEATAESKWARGIATDFWGAVLGNQEEQAAGLLSPELTEALVSYDRWGGVGGELKKIAPPNYLTRLAIRYGRETSASITSSESAPDRSEVVVRGKLSGKDLQGKKVAADFRMRVAKQREGGGWCIRYILVTDLPSK